MGTDNIYDVIIIGAGPAGLTAGKFLASRNKKILILEKNNIAGDKICAGGLTLKDFKKIRVPDSVITKKFKSANLCLNGHCTKFEFNTPWLWTCDRKDIGKWQLEEAQKAGAIVEFNSEVIKIDKESVSLKNGQRLFFKYLIGADGSNSIVRRFIGLKSEKVGAGMHYLVTGSKFNELEVFFDYKKFGPTYAWIFPRGEIASVGVGINPKFSKSDKIKIEFDNWCQEHGIDVKKYKFESALINYDYQGVEFGNIFLAGDAAGLANGVTGEGIYAAILSGKEVAYKIINPDYDLKELKKMVKMKKMQESALTLLKHNKTAVKIILFFVKKLIKSKFIRNKVIILSSKI
jgi:geranylgeranyl reductase